MGGELTDKILPSLPASPLLDTNTPNCSQPALPAYCPTPRRGALVGTIAGARLVAELECKRWDCPVCGPKKQYSLRKRIEQVPANRLLTLTHAPRPGENPTQALQRMRVSWHHLYQRIRRRHPKRTLKYIAVVEWTKAGWPHLHILMQSKYLPQKWVSRAWKELHGASIVDVRRTHSARGAASYVAKYLTKDNRCPPRLRRWSASRGYLPPKPPYLWPDYPEAPTFSFSRVPAIHYILYAKSLGSIAIDAPRGNVLLIEPYPPPPT